MSSVSYTCPALKPSPYGSFSSTLTTPTRLYTGLSSLSGTLPCVSDYATSVGCGGDASLPPCLVLMITFLPLNLPTTGEKIDVPFCFIWALIFLSCSCVSPLLAYYGVAFSRLLSPVDCSCAFYCYYYWFGFILTEPFLILVSTLFISFAWLPWIVLSSLTYWMSSCLPPALPCIVWCCCCSVFSISLAWL